MTLTTRETLEKEWAGFLDRPPMDSEYAQFVGKPLEVVLDTVWKSDEFKNRMDGLRKMYAEWKAGSTEAEANLNKIKEGLGLK